ncbi:2OG-Fe(II) oxygenase family protein [Amycolatopsis alkalitolerans]|uniref:Isopenicillin N synthase family oxygenase n=1 Tax=Amycolatopsis alkalitolerans TaxID=2547244 RepID=A0A5C4LSD1_9PSEU|nr:2OG-Fe(II) oxygenase family protein [Amycolatopsis alkalitolerans]TNC20455.1 isopenicillin N synthase family oxygenase [Amycolatopsis alkalitolerans]
MKPAPVPVLDLATATGAELVAGLQSSSCVFLTGMATFGADLAAMLASARAFFALPEREKSPVRWDGTGPWQGWQPVYDSGPAASPMERFELALPDPDPFPDADEWAGAFGQWPGHPAEFRSTWARYYRTMRELANHLVTELAKALSAPAADLPAWTARQHSNLCVNHYLAQAEPPEPGAIRSGAHTDIGGITLLWAENNPGGGLEARLDGAWVPVVFPPDALLLQAGDLLRWWSGGLIPANEHRVINPRRAPDVEQTDRYSVVFFHHPDLDAPVGPAATARTHVMRRQQDSYTLPS